MMVMKITYDDDDDEEDYDKDRDQQDSHYLSIYHSIYL